MPQNRPTIPEFNFTYPVCTMYKLKSHGFANTLMHLLSIMFLNSVLPAERSNPIILLSQPTDNIDFFCCNPATPMTAEVWKSLCTMLGFHESSLSSQSITAWSLPPVTKHASDQGMKLMLFMIPFVWGFSGRKVTFLCINSGEKLWKTV